MQLFVTKYFEKKINGKEIIFLFYLNECKSFLKVILLHFVAVKLTQH